MTESSETPEVGDSDSFASFFNTAKSTEQEQPPVQDEVESQPPEVSEPPVEEVPETPPAEEPKAEEKPPEPEPDVQNFYVKDPVTGVREKQSIDWTKRDEIIREVSKARGLLPKLQSQRDQFKTKLAEMEPKYEELNKTVEGFREAYAADGAMGVLKILADDEDELSAMLDSIYEERHASLNQTEEERREKELAKLRKEQETKAERMERELQEMREKAAKEAEERQLREEERSLQRVYSKWEFKLKDRDMQEEINDMLWDRATARLDRLASEGVEITDAVKEAQFRLAKQSLKKFAQSSAKSEGKRAVDTAKSRAASIVTSASGSGATTDQETQAALKKAMKGSDGVNFASFFNNVRGK